jgi:uncharacterized membrane protein YkoI
MTFHITTRRTVLIAGGAALSVLIVSGAAAGIVDDDAADTPITGSALEQAKDAALAHNGGGRVTGTEVGDEESFYEVEITLADGTQLDVQLDRDFAVVGSQGDDETEAS